MDRWYVLLFKLGHEDVGIEGRHAGAHHCAINLEIMFVVELKIVFG